MSRVTYNEDDLWGAIRWAGAAKKAIYGKRGQLVLRELEAALLALPEPKLITDEFANDEGEVCALGALAKARGIDYNAMADWDVEWDDVDGVTEKLGITRTLAWEIMAQNDDGGFEYPPHPLDSRRALRSCPILGAKAYCSAPGPGGG